MREIFRQDLVSLADGLDEMSALVSDAIHGAAACLDVPDAGRAAAVITGDDDIDILQQELDERAVDILARQAPVAGDLRIVVATLRMSASVERMGDLARHVAQLVRLRYPEPVIPAPMRDVFRSMSEDAEKIAAACGKLLRTHDLSLVDEIDAIDDRLDALHRQVFVSISGDWQGTPSQAVDVALASRYLERFGDHAVSVSGRIVYLLTGEWQPEPAPA